MIFETKKHELSIRNINVFMIFTFSQRHKKSIQKNLIFAPLGPPRSFQANSKEAKPDILGARGGSKQSNFRSFCHSWTSWKQKWPQEPPRRRQKVLASKIVHFQRKHWNPAVKMIGLKKNTIIQTSNANIDPLNFEKFASVPFTIFRDVSPATPHLSSDSGNE